MRIEALKEGSVTDLINTLIESGHLIRLSDDRVSHLLGNGVFKILGWHGISSGSSIVSIDPSLRNDITRAYKLKGSDCILLTSNGKDKFVWIHRNSHERIYKAVKIEEMLDNVPEDIIEHIVFNIDLF